MALKISNPLYASRALGLRALADGKPASLDEAARSVEVVASTEEPALVWDWDKWRAVPEVLLMQGCRVPASGQTPLLDTHSRYTVNNVLGSFREIRSATGAAGAELVGRMYFADVTPDAEKAWQLVRQGHVTDVSVGYEINAHIWIEDGQTTLVEGREFTGPLRVVTDWSLFELSLCPIGADSNAKIRQLAGLTPEPAPAAGPTKENNAMAKKSGGKSTAKKNLRNIENDLENNEIPGEEGEELPPVDDPEYVEPDGTRADGGEDEEDEENKPEGERKKAVRLGAGQAEQIRRGERARMNEINAACDKFGIGENMRAQLVNDGVSANMAKAQILDMVQRGMGGMNPAGSGSFRVETGRTANDKFRTQAQGALLARANVALSEADIKMYGNGGELRGYTLKEMCRECLRMAGQPTGGNVLEMVGRALTTTDLPALLVETQRRRLVDAWEAAEETWSIWCGEGEASDFKKNEAVSIDSDLKLLLKHENDEHKYGKLGELKEVYFLQTFSRKLAISREAIINDDLTALTKLPYLMGLAAAETVGDVAYAPLLLNPNMSDGKALFHADHKNLYVGAGGIPTVASVGTVVTGMKKQKTPMGNRAIARPKFYIAPVSLEIPSDQFFDSQLSDGKYIVGDQANPLKSNPHGGKYTRVYDPRLDDLSENDWYMAGGKGFTVDVFFLDGIKEPFMDSQVNFNTDGVDVLVRMDVGSKAMNWLSLAKATA